VRIPLVVKAAPLYRCFLDDHDEPVLKRVEYGTVLLRPPGYKAVTIMNEMYLAEKFVSQMVTCSAIWPLPSRSVQRNGRHLLQLVHSQLRITHRSSIL
jgi:hypothetical protein